MEESSKLQTRCSEEGMACGRQEKEKRRRVGEEQGAVSSRQKERLVARAGRDGE